MKKYIIFDFDGTLVCTNDIIIESWQATYEHFLGVCPDRRVIEGTFGEPLRHTVAVKFPEQSHEEVRKYYRAYQDAHSDGKVYVFDGITELLKALRSRGYRIGIATSRTAVSFRKYMKELGLEGYVDEVVAMEDVSRHKPDPESVFRILEKLGGTDYAAEEAIMIGDTKYDIGCAMNAGVDSVLVGWSHYVDEEDMKASEFEPTYRISRPSELLSLI